MKRFLTIFALVTILLAYLPSSTFAQNGVTMKIWENGTEITARPAILHVGHHYEFDIIATNAASFGSLQMNALNGSNLWSNTFFGYDGIVTSCSVTGLLETCTASSNTIWDLVFSGTASTTGSDTARGRVGDSQHSDTASYVIQ